MKVKKILFLAALAVIIISTKLFALQIPVDDPSIYTNKIDEVIDTKEVTSDPIRDGAYGVVNSEKLISNDSNPLTNENLKIQGVATDPEIQNFDQAKDSILNRIKQLVNYSLAMLSFVALLYLIYHGFMIVFKAADDNSMKEHMKSIKRAIYAIAGIGLSYLIINLIIYILKIITNA